jgi:hypothetical protein
VGVLCTWTTIAWTAKEVQAVALMHSITNNIVINMQLTCTGIGGMSMSAWFDEWIISKILPDIEQSKPVRTRLNTSRRLFGLLMMR